MAGIAAGQVIAYSGCALFLLWYLNSGPARIPLHFSNARLSWDPFRDILRVGALACISPVQSILTVLILTRLALDHPGVIQELNLPAAAVSGPGRARFVFDTLGAAYAVLHRVYELGVSLPDAPLREFERRIADLTRTEAERLVVQRIGQDVFRDRLMHYWQGRCPLTGISDPALLRASHIIPWADCETDAERLDVHNGLLLSALWDAAFDRALVTFDDQGRPELSPSLSEQARVELRWTTPIPLTHEHRRRLTHHRERARFQS